METELKFALSPEARRRIEHYAATQLSAGEALRHADRTTYYDTPDHALQRAGLRLRSGHRRNTRSFVQAMKAADGVDDGVDAGRRQPLISRALVHWSSSRRSAAMKKIAKACAAFERARPFWH